MQVMTVYVVLDFWRSSKITQAVYLERSLRQVNTSCKILAQEHFTITLAFLFIFRPGKEDSFSCLFNFLITISARPIQFKGKASASVQPVSSNVTR